MIIPFQKHLKSEFLKCRNTAAFWLTVLGAAFIPAINVLKYLMRPDYFVPRLKDVPWKSILTDNWQFAAGFFLTMFVVLVTSLVVQIEYRNNTWKLVYTTPRTYTDIFFSKLIVLHFLILICFFLFNIFIILSAQVIAWVNSDYHFVMTQIPAVEMVSTSVKMYISVIAMISIQYGLSLYFRNFIVPIGIGLCFFTIGFMIRQWEQIEYYPYMYPFLIYFPNPGLAGKVSQSTLLHSFQWYVVATGVGLYTFIARNEKA